MQYIPTHIQQVSWIIHGLRFRLGAVRCGDRHPDLLAGAVGVALEVQRDRHQGVPVLRHRLVLEADGVHLDERSAVIVTQAVERALAAARAMK